MKNSPYYIAPVRDWTHDLPHTVASNMVKVSHALNHSATAAVACLLCSDKKQQYIKHLPFMNMMPLIPSIMNVVVYSSDHGYT